jgi:hypothetical protein
MRCLFWQLCPLDKITRSSLRKLAEVVGSNPTRSMFINLVNYVIELSLILIGVGQI